MDHINFWWEFVGKVGAPIFAATLVACLLSEELYLLHGILMLTGIGMMGLSHWREYHLKGDRGKPGYD
jgi:hypothetical protein